MTDTIDEIRSRVKEAQKNYINNLETIEGILVNERGYPSRKPGGEDVVVICSGGLDSSIMLDIVIKEYGCKVHPLFFRRGATNEKLEEAAFDFFVDFYRHKYPINMRNPGKIEYQIPPKQLKGDFPKELAMTVGHPLRNSTMQNLAVMYAVSLDGKYDIKVRTVFTGSVGEDNTEPETGLLSLRAQTLNTCINLGDWGWQVTSPLTDTALREEPIFKTQLIEYALERGIPLEKTRTCFGGEEEACGTCGACVKRLDAFEYVKVKDPVKYRITK